MMIGIAHIDDPAAASAAKRAFDFFDVPAAAIRMADKDDDKGTPGGNDGDGDSETGVVTQHQAEDQKTVDVQGHHAE